MHKQKYAYVNLMYGNNDYFLGTLIFIISLMKTKPKYDTILLYTFDVPKYKIDILKKYYTITKEITYIDIKKTSRARFKEIFTKLKIFTLTDYEKVLYLDNDMYVNKNLDHVFEKYNTPAGVAINEDMEFKDGEQVYKKNVVFNAGFWLIKPSLSSYKKMFYNLKNFDTNKELEQEYVSYFFNKKWTNISYLYNYQFSLASLDPEKERTKIYKKTKIDQVYVIHYSTSFKPWNILSDTSLLKKKEWIKIYRPYYEIWLKLFLEVFNYYRKNGINILNLEKQFDELDKYLLRVYPNLKVLELTDFQKDKLNLKLNQKIGGSNYTIKYFLEQLTKHNIKIFIVGGTVRCLFNDEEINDIDLVYKFNPNKFEKFLKNNFDNLKVERGKKYKEYFLVGKDTNEIDLFYIDKLDTHKNTPANYMILDYNTNIIYDLYGTGINNAEKKIFAKPPDISYETWLNASGYSSAKLGRLIKFIMLGYKTFDDDRIQIYNDWYYNKNDKNYYKSLKKYFHTDLDLKFKIIKEDINKLNLKFTGEQFINKLKSKL